MGSAPLPYGPGQAYPSRAVRGAAPGEQQLHDVQVVVMDGHVQGSQAVLQGGDRQREELSLRQLSPEWFL